MTLSPLIMLNDGYSIPQLGLGTWPLDDEQVATAVVQALEAGYRHIDTAVKYGNEEGVGNGIRAGGVDRSEIFVTTKLDGQFQGEDRAVAGLEGSLTRMGLDYVDLLLIHWPLPARDDFVSTWKTFERLQAEGKVRSIGVSNFKPAHLERLLAETDVVPAVNQIQLSPAITREAEREFNARHGIVTESYSPLGGSGASLLGAPLLAQLGEKYDKTPAQLVLRWHIEKGLVVIPKSGNPERMQENLDIFDFALDRQDLAELAILDEGPGAGNDSDATGH
ncbi:aldo/keto reductase [Pseudarthrobacter sp. NIBRBAC000502772]|uniref:aldo/keto reductase n=1 Tax=Pseudarthrobacter sp. NIBRBAC000502772 TaxID=2590775 RepID=UPI0011303B54|nr:aldo/keto reductase [Pseudarthrobacter sp. NIBRBAC000502772]QDG65514.1 aldo/keto reductase [Pseudarthrobacter sp. NIBRBAC000502772]